MPKPFKLGERVAVYGTDKDGKLTVIGMTEYPEPRLWKYVGWIKRCLAKRKKERSDGR